jgi:hypothetical protein
LKPFQKINVDDYELNKIQDNTEACLQQFIQQTILQGNLVKNVTLVSGSNKVQHGLARTPILVMIGLPSTQATVWKTAMDEKQLTISTSADTTVSFWVC